MQLWEAGRNNGRNETEVGKEDERRTEIKEERKWTNRIRECSNWTFERPLHNRGSLYSYYKEVGKERGSTEHMMQLWEAGRNNGLNETEVGYERGEECAGDGLKHKIKC